MLDKQRGRKECQEQVWAEREMSLFPSHTLEKDLMPDQKKKKKHKKKKRKENPSPLHSTFTDVMLTNEMHRLDFKMALQVMMFYQKNMEEKT